MAEWRVICTAGGRWGEALTVTERVTQSARRQSALRLRTVSCQYVFACASITGFPLVVPDDS
ncbi:hypothetical protein J6590_035041 [Homalodisca vitripennis]|nr:hypothetical protein J6590_035041 [Homalodisca vitripennis]